MISEGFMEKLYRGKFDETLFAGYREPADDEGTVDRLITRYRELLEAFPPDSVEQAGRLPDELLHQMGAAGLFGATVPKAYGGLGLDLFQCERIIEELSPLDLSTALVFLAHLLIGIKGIDLYGTEEQKQKYLTASASGSMIFAFALTEPGTGSDARHIETTARLSDDGKYYILNGTKTYITNAGYAGGMTLFAQMDPERPGFMGAFIVETAWEGVKIGKDMPKMGLKASSTASVQLRDVRVPIENLLGRPGEGFQMAMTILHYGRMGLGAASKGITEHCATDMLRRARSRKQFGREIIAFPLIQEKIGRARALAFTMEAMNYFATALLEDDPDHGAVIETSHCKLFGTTRTWETAYETLQLFGGSGYIATQPYEKRMRDFRVTTIFEGTTEIHSIYPPLVALNRIGKELKDRGRGIRRLLYLAANLSPFGTSMKIPLVADDDTVRRAFRFVRRTSRTMQKLLFTGIIRHGKAIAEQEFLLRRICTLSLYTFAIASILAKFNYMGRDNIRGEWVDYLAYILDEATEAARLNRSLDDSRQEALMLRIVEGTEEEQDTVPSD